MEFQNLKDDITFIDFDKDPGYISFTTAKNARKNLNIKYPEKKLPQLRIEISFFNLVFTIKLPLTLASDI